MWQRLQHRLSASEQHAGPLQAAVGAHLHPASAVLMSEADTSQVDWS